MNQYDRNYPEMTRQDYNQLDKCGSLYMIGRLRNGNPTNVTKIGNIQIYVDPLCDDPEPVIQLSEFFNDSDNYIGFDTQQSVSMLPNYYDSNSDNYEQRQEELCDLYNKKLIIFQPIYSENYKLNEWFKNFRIVNLVEDDIDKYFSFKTVPRIQMEVIKFEQILKKGEYFDLQNYDGEICDPPEIVLCGQYAYRLKDPKNDEELLESNANIWTRWKCTHYEDVVKIDMTTMDTYKSNVIRASDSIVFMETNLYSAVLVSDNFIPFEEDKIKAALINNKPATLATDKSVSEDESDEDEISNDEEEFIKGLQQLTLNNGLQYKTEDLINFHTSIKTNPLTILAGMSGTGKSRLALNYAKMLNLSEDNKDLLFMPISPSYTEPSDVLGYLNSMNGLYVPSETGLIQFLIHAKDNPDRMHMVIFDEMNLSQVEYWFSPFISILEKDKNERILTLYDDDAHCINEKVYPSKIKIGENVIFVGTVNIDDTTKDFSDRLLDRTFVIKLEKVRFIDFYNDYIQHKSDSEKIDIPKVKCKNVNQFISWCHGNDRTYVDAFKDHEEEINFFDDLNDLIKKYIPDGGISHRVLKNIGNYILNVPNFKDSQLKMNRRDVLDIVINQTVITKIRGTEMQLQELIGSLNTDRSGLEKSELNALLDKYNEISDFRRTRDSLMTKAEELRINGYTN